jgi:hypothetical protein
MSRLMLVAFEHYQDPLITTLYLHYSNLQILRWRGHLLRDQDLHITTVEFGQNKIFCVDQRSPSDVFGKGVHLCFWAF